MEDEGEPIAQDAQREIDRINKLFEPWNGVDREDVISYAKEIVALRRQLA